MVKMTGGKAHAARLKFMVSPEAIEQVGAALKAGGELIEEAAAHSIEEGSVSGDSHVPSPAGSPPNSDTGVLSRSIQSVQVEVTKVEISADAPYAAIHEFGGTIHHPGGTPYYFDEEQGKAVFISKNNAFSTFLPVTKAHDIVMPERPFMRPAVAKERENVKALVRAAVEHIARGGRVG